MKGDFSRLRFSPNKNYTSVLQQQGRVSLDADANEQCAINDYLRATETVDVVGKVGGPIHDEGFSITVTATGIEIGKGRYYVDGILCENDRDWPYLKQPYLINPSPTDQTLLTELQAGSISGIQVYLQVWRRLVTALDDPCLREPALGQADTTDRLQTIWQVVAKALTSTQSLAGTVALTNGSATVTGTGTSFTSLQDGQWLVFASDSTRTPYQVSAIASDTSLTLAANYAGATAASTTASVIEPAGQCCDSMETRLLPVRDPGKLKATTSEGSGDCTCQPTPAAGYRGLENQLYRVEIHQPGNETEATFKWSRENGSVVSAVTGISGTQVTVDSLGPDSNLGFSGSQWVEIYDDSYVFGQTPNQPGNLYYIQSTSPETSSVTVSPAVPAGSIDTTKNARMRRWDQIGSSATASGISLSAGTWLNLESGIQVEFSKGNYVSGDYWLIPARTATGNIEWPRCDNDGDHFQPAHHTDVFEAPLACIQWDTTKKKAKVQDCRKPFYPLTELKPVKAGTCCTYRVGKGGDYTSIQTAIDNLPAEGGEVCILPGIYYENVFILGRRDVVIHGCGWQTRVASQSLNPTPPEVTFQAAKFTRVGATNPIGAVFTIAASAHIELRSFAVEAADDEAGILIDGTETALSTNQTGELQRLLIRLRGVTDVTIEDMVLTAATYPAVLAQRVDLLRIDRNRVAMKNVKSQWQAIYASGTEIHIDRNWVGIQSAANDREWLPYTVSEDLSGATSSATVSTEKTAGMAATTEMAATNLEFFNVATLGFTLVSVALHPGGIQIGGTSTDVYILENEIEGGSRNGITLGSFAVLDTKGDNSGIWIGAMTTSESDTCDCTGTLQTSGTYPGKTGYKVVAGGILTNIQIHRNRIRNMGLCGIGPVGFFNLLEEFEIITIVGLNISANAISGTVLRNLAAASGVAGVFFAYGAICVPDVQNLIVRDNTLTDFGPQPGADVCGIFVFHGELIEISRNQVLETRDWTNPPKEPVASLSLNRGGIIILLGTPPAFYQPLDNSLWVDTNLTEAGANTRLSTPIYEPGLPAVRVEHNVVRVPMSFALEIIGFGPFAVVNNHLACGGLVPAKGFTIAQTVFILNMGASIESTSAANLPSKVYSNANSQNNSRASTSIRDASCGAVLFSNNMCQLEATASRQSEDTSVLIFTPDHLIFSNNHCWLDTARLSALADALLLAGTLNVVGNRFQEADLSVLLSALTIGVVNITGQNISTFCILVLGPLHSDNNNIALVQLLYKELCADLEKAFTRLP
jgi:hypothetical protein